MTFNVGNIDEFKSLISASGGMAKTNLYFVVIPPAPASRMRSLSFFCKTIQLPSRQIATLNREVGIDNQKVAYGHAFADVSMTFRVMNDQYTREFFNEWQNRIVRRSSGEEGDYSIAFQDTYVTNVEIYQLKRGVALPAFNRTKDLALGPININLDLDIDIGTTSSTTYKWTLERAYPVTFQQESLSDEEKGGMSEITVEFAYQRWNGTKDVTGGDFRVGASLDASTDIKTKIVNKLYGFLN